MSTVLFGTQGADAPAAEPVRRRLLRQRTDRRLGTRAALAVVLVLAAAIGGATLLAIRAADQALRLQAEDTGRQAARTAATSFRRLEEASAANVARTLDLVLDGPLRGQAGATAMLIEAAEAAGRSPAYVNDALRQIVARSRIRRIDVASAVGQGYSSAASGLLVAQMEPAFQTLQELRPQGRTQTVAAVDTGAGLFKAAASQGVERSMVVRLEQSLNPVETAATYGQRDDRQARALADEQAQAIALLAVHAVELAREARWSRQRILQRLSAIVESSDIQRIVAAAGQPFWEYVVGSSEEHFLAIEEEHDALVRAMARAGQGSRQLLGRYDADGRWIAVAAAARDLGQLRLVVQLATRAGEGRLVETGWQAEADRLAAVQGVLGVWVWTTGDGIERVAAAAPRSVARLVPLQGPPVLARWDGRKRQAAALALRTGEPTSTAVLELLTPETARVISTAPLGAVGEGSLTVVVLEQDARGTVTTMRDMTLGGLVVAFGAIAVLGLCTTMLTRRWLTGPIERIAEAARCLEDGDRPPDALLGSVLYRRDEVGELARSFDEMTEEVLARHDELEGLVDERTAGLQEANDKLQAGQDRINREVRLAKSVQESLVPTGMRSFGRLTVCSRVTPARDLGGDFVCVRPQDNGQLFVAVGDVSGKGVAAALFMACAQAALESAVAGEPDISRIAWAANRRLCDGNELGMFVTGIFALIDIEDGAVQYVCAGHEPAITIAADGTLGKLPLTDGIPLGLEEDYVFEKSRYRVEAGETVFIYTDGVTDACNPQDENYGEIRLQELAARLAARGGQFLVGAVWDDVLDFAAGTPAVDDMTCMVLQRAGHADSVVGQPRW